MSSATPPTPTSSLLNSLHSLMPKYVTEEELVSDLTKENDVISFTLDLIDDDVPVTIRILNRPEDSGPIVQLRYDRRSGTNIASDTRSSFHREFGIFEFKERICDFLEEFLTIRDRTVEFYDSMDRTATTATHIQDPGSGSGSPVTSAVTSPVTHTRTDSGDISMSEDDFSEMSIDGGTDGDTDTDTEEDEEDDVDDEEGPYVVELDDGDASGMGMGMPGMGMGMGMGMSMGLDDDEDPPQRVEEPYVILTPEEMRKLSDEAIAVVAERMFLGRNAAEIVLRAYEWQVERIMNVFLDTGRDSVLIKVGLDVSSIVEEVETPGGQDDESRMRTEDFECLACMDDVSFAESTAVRACGHRFCNRCWERYIRLRIRDGLSRRIHCMGYKCDRVVDGRMVAQFITDPETKARYDIKVLESFVEDNPILKWCQSAPHCGNAARVRVSAKTPLEVKCTCGLVWCFVCLDEPHLPASCKMVQLWKRKCADDSETLRWIQTNTRVCPKCQKSTEKNGGCNHISCSCGAHWCWACGKLFDAQTVYSHSCGKFLEVPDHSRDASRAALDRYLHYFNHYDVHHSSLKNQKRLRLKMEKKMQAIFHRRPNSAWLEVKWLQEAIEVLLETRRALMWSYAFAFYLFDRHPYDEALHGCRNFRSNVERMSAKNIFEDKQEQLERNIELLAHKLDLRLEEILEEETKQSVMGLSIIAEKYCHALFDVIREKMLNFGDFPLPEPRRIATLGKTSRSHFRAHVPFSPPPPPPRDDRDVIMVDDDEDAMLQAAIAQSLQGV